MIASLSRADVAQNVEENCPKKTAIDRYRDRGRSAERFDIQQIDADRPWIENIRGTITCSSDSLQLQVPCDTLRCVLLSG